MRQCCNLLREYKTTSTRRVHVLAPSRLFPLIAYHPMPKSRARESSASQFLPTAPFNDPDADLILRTLDGVQFSVSRIALSLASPVLKNRVPPGTDDSAVAMQMEETAPVLDRVLRFCYSGAEPIIADLQQLQETLDIALLKYDMQSIVPFGKAYLRAYFEKTPLAVYAIACRHEWKDVAVEAAKLSLQFPVRVFGFAAPVQFQCMLAHRYHALLEYHAQCGHVAQAATSCLKWLALSPEDQPWFQCSQDAVVCPSGEYRDLADYPEASTTAWFTLYLKNAGDVLAQRPGAKLDSMDLMDGPLHAMMGCPSCRQTGFRQLIQFANGALHDRILEEIDSVRWFGSLTASC
ncbi:hypothetical protein C8R43DRAFT_1028000 [Mycena crocata]|nr:hypothetical protein C8R43DRAFT_1028000 [Mycena crocata]